MITNKDISIDSENGKITLNGNKYDLGTQGEIDTAVKGVYSVMGQNGAKNLIPYPYYETTKTQNGITFTDNGDGTITVSGTASADATFEIRNIWSASNIVELLPNTIYAFSGCPVGGSTSTYLVQFVNEESDMSNKSWFDDIGTGGTLTTTDVKRFVGSRIVIKSGTAFSTSVTFKPMLRLASDTDNTYEPYAKTNKQLTDQVADVKDTIGDITQTGVTGASVAEQITALDTDKQDTLTVTDVDVTPASTGHATPTQSGGGAYFESLVTYDSISIPKSKILSVSIVFWTGTPKAFTLYLGETTIGALTDSSGSIYKSDDPAAKLTLRIVHTS